MSGLRIIVAGLAGSFSMAGTSLHWLQYPLGLLALGHDVLYLEHTGAWYYDPKTATIVDDVGLPLQHLRDITGRHGLDGRWTFIDHHGVEFGVTGAALRDFLHTADLLINVTGAMKLREQYMVIPRRAYLDTDPGFIQLRVSKGSQKDIEHLRRHTVHFTFGRNIGASGCPVPTGGFAWHGTVQPVYLPFWPRVAASPRGSPFTTIVKWDASGHVLECDGEVYGAKDLEFPKFVRLPELTGEAFELAMAGESPVDGLELRGWRCRSGAEVSATWEGYRAYIQESRGEWSIAKNGYVKTKAGWFSDRSATYLATGRPVVVQSTGFERWLPSGIGVVPFSTLDEAVDAIRAVQGDYEKHCRAAREIAEATFDSSKVLGELVEAAMTA